MKLYIYPNLNTYGVRFRVEISDNAPPVWYGELSDEAKADILRQINETMQAGAR